MFAFYLLQAVRTILLKLPETSGSFETIQPFKPFSNVYKSECVSKWMSVHIYLYMYRMIQSYCINNFCRKISFSLIQLFIGLWIQFIFNLHRCWSIGNLYTLSNNRKINFTFSITSWLLSKVENITEKLKTGLNNFNYFSNHSWKAADVATDK